MAIFECPEGSIWNNHLCKEYSKSVHKVTPSAKLNTTGKNGDESAIKKKNGFSYGIIFVRHLSMVSY